MVVVMKEIEVQEGRYLVTDDKYTPKIHRSTQMQVVSYVIKRRPFSKASTIPREAPPLLKWNVADWQAPISHRMQIRFVLTLRFQSIQTPALHR